jgi:hypothetical protein
MVRVGIWSPPVADNAATGEPHVEPQRTTSAYRRSPQSRVMTTNNNDSVGVAGAQGSTEQRAAADRGALTSDHEVFALFPPERETSRIGRQSLVTRPMPHALTRWLDSHHGRGRLATFFAIGLAIGIIASVMLRPAAEREHAVAVRVTDPTAPPGPAKTGNSAAEKTEMTPAGALTPESSRTGDRGARGGSLDAGREALATAPANTGTAARNSRAGSSRPTPRQQVTTPPRGARRTGPEARVPATRLAALAPVSGGDSDLRANRQRPTPAAIRGEAAPDTGISVPVSAAASDPDGDELIFHWSAPVGVFLDATARETRYVCPRTPSPTAVMVTVTVTDGRGAAASDTIAVQCAGAK